MIRRIVICIWLLTPGVAHADDFAAGGHARFEARYLRRTDAAPAPYDDHVFGGLAIRAFGGHPNVQYALGFDLFGGATSPAGFAYALHLRPVGIAFVDDDIRLSSTFGVGFDGVTAMLDPATRLPLDLLVELPIVECAKVEIAGELAWLPADDTRPRESAVSVRLRFDERFERSFRGRSANGVYLALEVAERHGATFIGASLGYSLDGAFRF